MCELPAVRNERAPLHPALRRRQAPDPGPVSEPGRFEARATAAISMPAGPIPDEHADPKPGADDDMTFSGGAPRGRPLRSRPRSPPKRWARPEEAVIHIYQGWELGQHAVAAEGRRLRRPRPSGSARAGSRWGPSGSRTRPRSRRNPASIVENVFEELDAPGEWYLDVRAGILYYKPEPGVDMAGRVVEAPAARDARPLRRDPGRPVEHVALEGFRLTQTASTFLADYDVPSLSDWAIHRGGAVFLEGTRTARSGTAGSTPSAGNAVFINNYNREGGRHAAASSRRRATARSAWSGRWGRRTARGAPSPTSARCPTTSSTTAASSASRSRASTSPGPSASRPRTTPSTTCPGRASASATGRGAATSSNSTTSTTPAARRATTGRSTPGDARSSGA